MLCPSFQQQNVILLLDSTWSKEGKRQSQGSTFASGRQSPGLRAWAILKLTEKNSVCRKSHKEAKLKSAGSTANKATSSLWATSRLPHARKGGTPPKQASPGTGLLQPHRGVFVVHSSSKTQVAALFFKAGKEKAPSVRYPWLWASFLKQSRTASCYQMETPKNVTGIASGGKWSTSTAPGTPCTASSLPGPLLASVHSH